MESTGQGDQLQLLWKECEPVPLEEAMYWDCFSPYVDVGIRSRLKV